MNVQTAFKSAVTLTRTADTNAYTANDAVGANTSSGGAVLTFTGLGPSPGGDVIVTTVKLEVDVNAVPSGMTSFRLYLYDSSPGSALADNAAWDLPSGDRAAFKGYIDLGTPVDLGSTLYVKTDGVNSQLSVAAGGTLYGYLVTNGGYTPGSGDVFKITLHAVAV